MSTLHDRIRAVVEERLTVAREASRRDEHTTPTGEHWQWECGNCDTVLAITPVTILSEYLECPACEGGSVALRSAEQYPTASVGPLPHFVVNYASEQRSVDALHIMANDPAEAILGAEHALWLLDEIAEWGHEYILGDKYLSCEADEGLPCSCGLDERRMRMLVALATRWRVEVDG